MAYLKMRYPGETQKQIREKCAGMLMHIILNQISAIWSTTPGQRVEAITALEWWDHQIKQGDLRPTLEKELDEVLCPDLAYQYQDKITE